MSQTSFDYDHYENLAAMHSLYLHNTYRSDDHYTDTRNYHRIVDNADVRNRYPHIHPNIR
jgi:hypothetical protein